MSVRERRNRKDSRGKTAQQIKRSQAAHEARYAEIIGGLHEGDLPLSGVGYLMGMYLLTDGSWPAGEGCDDAAGSEVAQVRRPPEG